MKYVTTTESNHAISERSKHLEWCKQRANEYVERNDMAQAFASFTSDMSKHPETANHIALPLGMMMMLGGQLVSQREMRDWINGFN